MPGTLLLNLRRLLPLVEWQAIPSFFRWTNSWRPGEIAYRAHETTRATVKNAGSNLDSFEAAVSDHGLERYIEQVAHKLGHRRPSVPLICENLDGVAHYDLSADVIVFNQREMPRHFDRFPSLGGDHQTHLKSLVTDLYPFTIRCAHCRLAHEIVHRDQLHPFLPNPDETQRTRRDYSGLRLLRPARVEENTRRFHEAAKKDGASRWSLFVENSMRARTRRIIADRLDRKIWDCEAEAYLTEDLSHRMMTGVEAERIRANVDDGDTRYLSVPEKFQDPKRVKRIFGVPWRYPLFHLAYGLGKSRWAVPSFRSAQLLGNALFLKDLIEVDRIFQTDPVDGVAVFLHGSAAVSGTVAAVFNSVALFSLKKFELFRWGGPMLALSALLTAMGDAGTQPVWASAARITGGLIAMGGASYLGRKGTIPAVLPEYVEFRKIPTQPPKTETASRIALLAGALISWVGGVFR